MAFPNNPTSPPVLELNSHAINSSCVGFWPLTQVQGATATDISTSGNDGTIAGTAIWESGSLGQNLQFDGTTHFIDTGAIPAVTSLPITVSAWVKPSATANRCMIASSWLSSGTNRAFTCELNAANALTCYITSDGTFSTNSSITATGTLTDGVWYHVVFVIQSGGAIYIDGVSQTLSGSLGSSMHTPNQNLLIGAGEPGAETFLWTGDLQNVRIFNTALSASDVDLLYSRPWVGTDYDETFPYNPPVPSSMSLSTDAAATSLNSGCVAWWPLTEGTGNTAADISGSSNDATGTAVSWENSTAGNAWEASGGYVQSSSFPVTNVSAFSISAWIKNNSTAADYLGTWSGFSGSTEKSVLWRGLALEAFVRNAADSAEASISTGVNLNTKSLESHNGMAHAVFVVDSGTATWYVNGVQVAQNLSFMAGPYIPTGNTDGLLIGEANGSAMTTGSVQNVRMWDRALTADEVTLLYERPWEGEATYGDALYNDPPPTLTLGTTAEDVAINTDCVGWWPLLETDDYASGAADISGNANNGTQSGGVLSAYSPLGGVASFDGVDDKIGVSNAYTYSSLTVSFWVRDNFGGIDGDYVSDRVLGTIGSYGGFAVGANGGTNTFRFFLDSGSTAYILLDATKSDILSQGAWHFITATFDSASQTPSVYVDGVDATSLFTNTGTGTLGSITSSGDLTIGNRPGTTSRCTNGDISNVRVWSRALSAVEVQSLYETPWIGSNYGAVAAFYNYIYRSKRFRRL